MSIAYQCDECGITAPATELPQEFAQPVGWFLIGYRNGAEEEDREDYHACSDGCAMRLIHALKG